jgi:general stress protein YciG
MIMANNQQNGNRGFASMDPQKQREIAAEGGRAAHASGNAHEFNSEEARRAGSMSHKNDGNQQSGGNNGGNAGGGNSAGNQQSGRSTRGGTPEQHARAGAQSHKNDKR